MTLSPAPRIFIVSAEVSGDIHGAALAREIRSLAPDVRLEGLGGPRMAAAGVRLMGDSSAWGVVGWFEAARQLRPFLRRLDALTQLLRAHSPDLLVAVDAPGFNLPLLKRLGGRIPAVYYVPPMVSIRRGRRAQSVAALGVRLLTIFPFEAEAYRRVGADVTFVGHPATELPAAIEPAARIRTRLGITPSVPVVGLLPGSRRQEITLLLDRMLDAVRRVRAAEPSVELLLALASPIFSDEVQRAVASSGLPISILEGARDVMAVSTVVLMASGTATVEAMVLGAPMVVTYRGSQLSWWFVPLAVTTRWAAIPNIMAKETVVPELLQGRATASAMSDAVLKLLHDPPAREGMRRRLAGLAQSLGAPGAPRRAAGEILRAMGMSNLMPDFAVQ